MWGFLTCLNDILVPHLKSIFDLNYAKIMLINSAFFGAYFVFSIPSAEFSSTGLGYQRTVVGLITMDGRVFVRAGSYIPSYPLFLEHSSFLPLEFTRLQVAANPYVTVLGSWETASSCEPDAGFQLAERSAAPPAGCWISAVPKTMTVFAMVF